MKAPDKIYMLPEELEERSEWITKPYEDRDVAYIRKEALTEWLKEKIRNYWADDENTMGIYPYALEEVINKINSL